jgi:tetratricopeptide (TPR) repeat protein
MMRARQDDFPYADRLIQEGLKRSHAIFGDGGPTAMLNRERAVLLNHQGRCEESLSLRYHLWTNAIVTAGPDHWSTIGARQWVAYHHAWYGNETEAVTLFEENLEWLRRHAPYSAYRQPGLDWLARLYWRTGRPQEAVALREELVQLQRRKYGADKASTRRAIRDLADLWARIGEWHHAGEVLSEVGTNAQPEVVDLIKLTILDKLSDNPSSARQHLMLAMAGLNEDMASRDHLRAKILALILDVPWTAIPATDPAPHPAEPDAYSAWMADPVPLWIGNAIAALYEQHWAAAVDLLRPVVAKGADLRDRSLAGFLLAVALARQGATNEAKDQFFQACHGLERIAGTGDLGDRWLDATLCALTAGFAPSHIDGVETPFQLTRISLSQARVRWQPVNEALDRVWTLSRHRRWREASAAAQAVLDVPGFHWEIAEASVIRWTLKLAVIHAMAGDRDAYHAVCGRQTWDEALLPPGVKPISLCPDFLSSDPRDPVLLDAPELAFEAEHGVERHVPEWEPLATGIAQLQAGSVEEATTELSRAQNAFNLHCRCVAFAFAAQANFQRGRNDQATALLDAAESILSEAQANQPGDLGRLWFEMGLSELAVQQTRRFLQSTHQKAVREAKAYNHANQQTNPLPL